MRRPEFIDVMSRGMATMEGFYMTPFQWTNILKRKLPADWKKPGDHITPAQRCNNPGNLRSWGNLPFAYGFAVFPKAEDGWIALRRQCEINIFGDSSTYPLRKTRPMSFFEFFAGQRDTAGNVLKNGYPGYAPAADKNAPATYAGYVLDYLKKNAPGFPASATIHTPIRSLIKEA